MPTKKMDAAHFIRKFSKIPARKWCTGSYRIDGRCCARGHCGEISFKETRESQALVAILSTPTAINDGNDKRYPQKTPRARILAALRDAQKAGR